MSLIPIDSVSSSGSEPGFDILKVFDGKLDTYWKPTRPQNMYLQINFYKPHVIQYLDIAFNEGNNRRYIFRMQYQNPESSIDWIDSIITETKGETDGPIRITFPEFIAKSVKIIFLSYTDIDSGNTGLIPEISELRIYGLLNEHEQPSSIPLLELPCPFGYYKNEQGICINMNSENSNI